MSSFLRVAFAGLIIFASGSYGLYYVFSGGASGLGLDFNNRSLNLINGGNNLSENGNNSETLNKRSFEDFLDEIEEDPEGFDTYEIEDIPDDDVVPDLEIKEVIDDPETLRQKAIQKEKEDEIKYGPRIGSNTKVSNSVPVPKYPNGDAIREREFTFDSIQRDPKLNDVVLDNLPNDFLGRKFKKYLILADANHVLWDIKHKQLIDYLTTSGYFAQGSIQNGYLTKDTNKYGLAAYCHKLYLQNPSIASFGVSSLADFNAVWNWCTLPEYWGKEKPEGWPVV